MKTIPLVGEAGLEPATILHKATLFSPSELRTQKKSRTYFHKLSAQ